MSYRWTALGLALLLATVNTAAAQEAVQGALARASKLSREHRYDEVVKLLVPLASGAKLSTPSQFELDAQLGRAYFHLGQYPEAYTHLRGALAIQPRRMEIGVYLEAAAWATGRRQEALKIFDGILASGARDLYLPVTLPGERSFLANRQVWKTLARHRRPLEIDLRKGSLAKARLGDSRSRIVALFHLPPKLGAKPVITARAGPEILWFLHFDQEDRLEEILIDLQHILRYTPYNLVTPSGLDWTATPARAMVKLGQPRSTVSGADGNLVLSWSFPGVRTSLEFNKAPQPAPPELPAATAVLSMIRLRRTKRPGGANP